MKFKSFVVAAALTIIGVATTRAYTIYTYTGNDFNVVGEIAPVVTGGGPYTTSQFISGYFVLGSPLGDNTTTEFVHPLSFSFSDGVTTLSSTNPQVSGHAIFSEITTNRHGVPVDWLIEMSAPCAGGVCGRSIASCFDPVSNCAYDFSVTLLLPSYLEYEGSSDVAGTWSVKTRHKHESHEHPADATPLPATFPLFATGLGALGLLGWRRKRKAVG